MAKHYIQRSVRAATSQPPEISSDESGSLYTSSDDSSDGNMSSMSSASNVFVKTRQRDYGSKKTKTKDTKKSPRPTKRRKTRKGTADPPSDDPADASEGDQDSTYTPPDAKPPKRNRKKKDKKSKLPASDKDDENDEDGDAGQAKGPSKKKGEGKRVGIATQDLHTALTLSDC